MRKLFSALLTGALVVAGLAAPVLTLPVAAAVVVEPEFTEIPLTGVDSKAVTDPSALVESTENSEPTDGGQKSSLQEEPETVSQEDLAALSALERTESFMAAGVTWDAATSEHMTDVAVRVLEDGVWGEWVSLEIESTGVTGERGGTQPLLALDARGIQARVQTESGHLPLGLRIDLVDPGTSAADGQTTALPLATAQGATGSEIKPKILTRKQWGADESRASNWPALSANLNAIYVHHTAGTNSYSKAQSAALVRGIYAFHTGARGWPDIGYQFVVDKYGTVYQGRVDAIEDLPVGAQAGGYNTSTIGVSAMGNYDVVAPSAVMLSAIEQVVAWKAYQHGVNPTGKTTLITGASTGSSVKAAPNSIITVPTVLGHRDTNGTACPGRYLYAKLPSIRSGAGKRVTSAVTKHGKVTDSLAVPVPVAVALSAEQFPAQVDGTAKYSWKPVPGAVRYQVLTRSASHGAAMPDDRGWTLYGTVTATSTRVAFNPGQTRYVAVRAIDAAGRRGPVGYLTQATRPVSTNALVWAKAWQAELGNGRVNGTLRSVRTQGATVQVTGVHEARQIVVFGDSGRHFGAMDVLHGNRVIGRIDFNSATPETRAQRVLALPVAVSGMVTLKTTSSSPVVISALALPRTAAKTATKPPSQSTPKPVPNVAPQPTLNPVVPAPVKPALPLPITNRKGDFPVSLTASKSFRWNSVPGAQSYQIQVRAAKHGETTFSDWKTIGTTRNTNFSVAMPPGQTVRVAVRTIDKNGGVSGRALFPKVTRPVRNSTLVKSTGTKRWGTARHPGYISGAAYSTKAKGAALIARSSKEVRTIQVVAATGPKNGRFGVYINGKHVKSFSTAGKSNLSVPFTVVVPRQSGAVTVKTLDANKTVRISAITTAR